MAEELTEETRVVWMEEVENEFGKIVDLKDLRSEMTEAKIAGIARRTASRTGVKQEIIEHALIKGVFGGK